MTTEREQVRVQLIDRCGRERRGGRRGRRRHVGIGVLPHACQPERGNQCEHGQRWSAMRRAGAHRGPSTCGLATAGNESSAVTSSAQIGRYSLWSEIVGPLSSSTYSIDPPPSTGRKPASALTAGGSWSIGKLFSVPVLPRRRPATGVSPKISTSVPDSPATARPCPVGLSSPDVLEHPEQRRAGHPVVETQTAAVTEHQAGDVDTPSADRGAHDLESGDSGSRPRAHQPDLFHHQFRSVVVTVGQHLRDDRLERLGVDRGQRRQVVGGDSRRRPAGHLDALLAEDADELACPGLVRFAAPLVVTTHPGVVDEQCVVRARLRGLRRPRPTRARRTRRRSGCRRHERRR